MSSRAADTTMAPLDAEQRGTYTEKMGFGAANFTSRSALLGSTCCCEKVICNNKTAECHE